MNALRAELKKSRRRYHTLLSVLIALVVLLWSLPQGDPSPEELARGYSFSFYAFPIMNTVILPLGTAVLASRIWDIESRENNCRLLFTLQSRSTLFGCKAALGLAQILLICLLESAGIPLLGRLCGYTEVLDLRQLVWLALCTFTVSAMLFFLWLTLSIRYANQVPTLAGGMLGSLLGLFSAYMPPWFIYLMPWGYYVPLSAMRMDWNRVTRETRFFPTDYPVWLLAFSAALLALCTVCAWRTLKKKEV